MTHRTTDGFWKRFERLPEPVQHIARKNYRLLDAAPRHPSLHFKKLAGSSSGLWSVRVGRGHRALALEKGGEIFWFWIGDHDEYERVIAAAG